MFKNVVALYGVPRSGTSWMGQILDSCPEVVFRFQPLFSYRFKNRILEEATTEDISLFFHELYMENEDRFLNQEDKRERGYYPSFKKNVNHCDILTYKEVRYLYTVPLLLERYENIKIIAMIRNPYDVLQSWINAPSEFKDDWDIEEEWLFGQSKNEFKPENYYGYHKWKEWVKMVTVLNKKYQEKLIVVKYEDLNEHATDTIDNIFSLTGIPFTEQTKQFIIESQSKTDSDAYSVYKRKGESRNIKFQLPPLVRKAIKEDLVHFSEAHFWGY